MDAQTPDKHGAALGRSRSLRFETGDLEPYAALNTGGRLGAFSAYTDTVLYAVHRNVSRLDVELYRLSPQTFLRLNSNWEAWDRFVPDEPSLVNRWRLQGETSRNEMHLLQLELADANGDALPPGLYYLEMSAPEVRARVTDYQPSRYMFVKSRLNLALKQSQDEVLVWATDLDSGQPVAGVPVSLYDGTDRLSATGETGADGVFLSRDLTLDNLWDDFFAMTGEPGEANFGLAYNRWEQGISPWDFDVQSEFWGSDYQGYLYTDRPIYRPGQTVYYKGILRADDDARYSLPHEIETVEVRIRDPQGKELYKETLPLSDMGTLYDQFVLSQEAPLGSYYIEIQDSDRDLYVGASFSVAEYKRPEFQVSVSSDQDAYLNGDRINVTVEGTYYFGGAVAQADVHWSILSRDHTFRYECPPGQECPWYSWDDQEWTSFEDEFQYGGFGHLVAEGDTQTGDQGRVTFNVLADITAEAQSQVYTIEASLTDINGQQVSNRTAVIVHKGQFYVGVAPRGYLTEVGDSKPVDLLTVDWDGNPVTRVPLKVVFMEHRWYSVRRQAEDGNFYWDWTAEDTPVFTTTVTTDGQGRAEALFTPQQAGTYRVRAQGRDQRGNEISSSAYFWVWGGGDYVRWRQESNNRIELIADKEEYQVGDVAEILIPSPYSGTVQALVTVERGHIMQTEVRELASNSEVLRLPITEDHVPNVFLSVFVVQGSGSAPSGLASFKMGLVKLPVSIEAKELNISLTPDKDRASGEHYAPRQTATYDVQVTDNQGRPLEAELSLRLADLAVLALADEPGPTLAELFWRDRGLGIKTSTPLVVAMEAFNRELQPEAKGGGGGGDGGLTRSQFADTAFWDPVVRTDQNGQAKVEVQLPDNLTTWRMQARGITAGTQVGRAEVDILSTLDLLVRPVLPRFFVAGDQAEIATIVHNNTSEPLETQIHISVSGLSLAGDTSQSVRIAAGDRAKVVWPVTALAVDNVQVRMWAVAGDLYDGREDALPVYRYSTPEVMATAGQLAEPGVRQEIVQLPRTFDPDQGELEVQIDGSLTAATQDAVDYLEHYPYECVEQTVSRFLPNVVTWQALDQMGVERPELRQELSQRVGLALQRLYNQQHYDGGWGWWVGDTSDPYLTAYVLHGLLEARRAGFVVEEEVMLKAVEYLRQELPSVDKVDTMWQANRLAYGLYVLAEHQALFNTAGQEDAPASRWELGLAIRLFEKRELLSQYGQATLAVALSLLQDGASSRVETLLGDLASQAVVSATGAHWEESQPDYWNMNTDTRSTAIVLWALSRLDPEHALLPNTVRWLMSVRQEGHWESTHTTAWSLLGLVEYMQASGELAGDFSYTLYLNGQEWASGDVSAATIDEGLEMRIAIGRLLVEEGNRLVIERHPPQADQTGEGQLYYATHLRYYLPADHIQALDRGILVARQYSPVDGEAAYTDTARVGDLIKVKLTIIAPTDLHYVVVEDPLPAGFEGVDLSLKTTSVVGEQPSLRNVTVQEETDWYRWYGWGWWWFSHSEMRDEKVSLFAHYLPRGTYEYTYLMRAGLPGRFLVMPATASQMYFPEVFGRSDGGVFTVHE
ncbi:MAG: MG2 domain-containing protein [Anaerolineae bacterium]